MNKKSYEIAQSIYSKSDKIIKEYKKLTNKYLTLADKIILSHMSSLSNIVENYESDSLSLQPDRIVLQDVTAQMVLLQYINLDISKVSIPTSIHCDHLVVAHKGVKEDLSKSLSENEEIYNFLKSAANKYGIEFWKPGAGIIHQVTLENYAIPGMMIIGTDSHTPNAGGICSLAIGVGGADAVDVMANEPFTLSKPKKIGIELKGKYLSSWLAPKDIIIKIAGLLTTKGGTNKIVEYFGEGCNLISCTGKSTITNMGAEIGATTSIFSYDDHIKEYLNKTNRSNLVNLTEQNKHNLVGDAEVYNNPSEYFDELYTINLETLQPHVAGPHSPDYVTEIQYLKSKAKELNLPKKISACLIGSCTNSSYEDITKCVDILKQAKSKKCSLKVPLFISPGSDNIYQKIKEDNLLNTLEDAGAKVLANACGPCIGQWNRDEVNKDESNNIITSFNRNFKRRNDGSPNTNSFIASPEIVTSFALSGSIYFNPLKDHIINDNNEPIYLNAPKFISVPPKNFTIENDRSILPNQNGKIEISVNSNRLQLLDIFPKNDLENDFKDITMLIKIKGKCTTDHISPAGKWLKYRGHISNISDNLYLGALNCFHDEVTGKTLNQLNNKVEVTSKVAKDYKKNNIKWFVIAGENYGEGSSREHAAMEPRHLNCKVIIAISFARIAERNIKRQGILPIHINKESYDIIKNYSKITISNISCINHISRDLDINISTKDSSFNIKGIHTMTKLEVKWFKHGGSINYLNYKNKSNK